uniref:Uncharacterized protein n=1 Tax=Rhizophagus irregularis (strain DAOM 181602 / DAOM 197198 / MUCL 43194) TaxID=747089 RepID=U9UX55_RHIID
MLLKSSLNCTCYLLPKFIERKCCNNPETYIKFDGNLIEVSYLTMEKWMKNQGFECLHVVKRLHKRLILQMLSLFIIMREMMRMNFLTKLKTKNFKITVTNSIRTFKFMELQEEHNQVINNNEKCNKYKSCYYRRNLQKDIKIEGEIPSIEGIFIKNNLPFGKFVITLTLPDNIFVL